jgi:hypothetical protein
MNRGNRGQVLVFVALAMLALLGMAALAVDVGFMYSTRNELQRCADAGALAGASAFTTGDWNDTSMASDHPRGIADLRARDYASRDVVVAAPLDPASDVATSFPSLDRIEVVTSRNVNLFFARIFGMGNRLITARAVAEAAVAGPPLSVNCIKPWAIPYPWQDGPGPPDRRGNPTDPNGLYDPGEHVYNDCEGGVGLCAGTRITLKIGSPSTDNTAPSGQQTSGQFFIIQGNLGGEVFQGANEYRNFIVNGCFPIDLTLPVDLMPGNKMGPTVQAVEELLAMDSGSTWSDADGVPSSSDYPFNVDGDWMKSPRVVRTVIYDPSVPMTGGPHGTQSYIPVGYSLAGFWIESVARQGNDGSVTGRYIPGAAFGGPGGGNPGPLTGTEVKIIRLVE